MVRKSCSASHVLPTEKSDLSLSFSFNTMNSAKYHHWIDIVHHHMWEENISLLLLGLIHSNAPFDHLVRRAAEARLGRKAEGKDADERDFTFWLTRLDGVESEADICLDERMKEIIILLIAGGL
ncbi:uncharacterized protein PpBr36_09576 [Pyricularia pennisetigena]|uniref:uncharacterized protein n=1 Tax=Pyricularia pennisetigena TaxID=1578925 RepID=UPI001151A748|nr:uncharacterized protein PpBr36_09576 [Pyricularia pennisetigena]TLS21719.1 hypothetical protein PpBr36_09576 [Pyricularia pennisetigena]